MTGFGDFLYPWLELIMKCSKYFNEKILFSPLKFLVLFWIKKKSIVYIFTCIPLCMCALYRCASTMQKDALVKMRKNEDKEEKKEENIHLLWEQLTVELHAFVTCKVTCKCSSSLLSYKPFECKFKFHYISDIQCLRSLN